MARHFAVIYKSQSGNKIRLSGSVEMDLLHITINYVAVKGKDYLFSWQRVKSCRWVTALGVLAESFFMCTCTSKQNNRET